MAKNGIDFDYDLMANQSEGAQKQAACVVCDTVSGYRWTDYHGEGICLRCGAPYQLQAGSPEQVAAGVYPTVNLKPEVVPVLRRYWAAHQRFTYLGTTFGDKPGLQEFYDWVDDHRNDDDVVAWVGPVPPAEASEVTDDRVRG